MFTKLSLRYPRVKRNNGKQAKLFTPGSLRWKPQKCSAYCMNINCTNCGGCQLCPEPFATVLHSGLGYNYLHSFAVWIDYQAKEAGSACSYSVSPNLRHKSCGFLNARLFAARLHGSAAIQFLFLFSSELQCSTFSVQRGHSAVMVKCWHPPFFPCSVCCKASRTEQETGRQDTWSLAGSLPWVLWLAGRSREAWL